MESPYLPYPLAEAVLAKMDSVIDCGKKFTKTDVDLTRNAGFPDIRTAFNEGTLTWKDILKIRDKGTLFRKWFATYGGNPEVALKAYGEEFRASCGITSYQEKMFSIVTYICTAAGAAAGAKIDGAAGAAIGALVGGMGLFAKDLFKASEEDGWKPRFFGNWIREIIEDR